MKAAHKRSSASSLTNRTTEVDPTTFGSNLCNLTSNL